MLWMGSVFFLHSVELLVKDYLGCRELQLNPLVRLTLAGMRRLCVESMVRDAPVFSKHGKIDKTTTIWGWFIQPIDGDFFGLVIGFTA